jgi:flagellar hook protein FlgE
MGFSFSTALSGMKANSSTLGVAGNNIANSNTTGFKTNTVSFADVYTGASIGSGVQTVKTTTVFEQGVLNDSGSSTNAALQGNGFFVVANADGQVAYTRAGEFSVDKDGYMVTPTGHRAQGYLAVDGEIPSSATVENIVVPLGQLLDPVETESATFRLNLDSSAATGAEFNSPVTVYDSKGVTHTLNLEFTKTATAGQYTVLATVDGTTASTSFNGAAATVAAKTFTFDGSGNLTSPTTFSVVGPAAVLDGATLASVEIELYRTNADGSTSPNITNFGSDSAVTSTLQDGFPAGSLVTVGFSKDGTGIVEGTFSNGQIRTVGQLAIASFNAQTELKHSGSNLYQETLGSGAPSVGVAGAGGRGNVIGANLEASTVDIATEFTNLIVAQRSFSANSRVINTISQALQEVLQIQ